MRIKGLLHHRDPCGHYDYTISIVRATGWTPQQISEMSEEFLEELVARLNAERRVRDETVPEKT